MRAVYRVVRCVVLMSALWGCAMHEGSQVNNEATQSYEEALRKLRMGLDEEQVRQLVGPPGTSEFYKSLNGSPVIVFHYQAPGKSESRETTSLFFENGRLMMWGSKFYE